MAGLGGFRGVSAAQDMRFSNKNKAALKKIKFPSELDLSVNYDRVNWTVMKEWVAKRVTELLGIEEEVLISMIHNHLTDSRTPAKEMHVELLPFLEKNTSLFMKELWALLHSASTNESGVPQQLLDAKQAELQEKRQLDAAVAAELAIKRAEAMERAAAVAAAAAAAAGGATTGGSGAPPRRSRFDQPAPSGGAAPTGLPLPPPPAGEPAAAGPGTVRGSDAGKPPPPADAGGAEAVLVPAAVDGGGENTKPRVSLRRRSRSRSRSRDRERERDRRRDRHDRDRRSDGRSSRRSRSRDRSPRRHERRSGRSRSRERRREGERSTRARSRSPAKNGAAAAAMEVDA